LKKDFNEISKIGELMRKEKKKMKMEISQKNHFGNLLEQIRAKIN
jgi:hypothetical protein